jgi:predicted nucleic acid-binding protein
MTMAWCFPDEATSQTEAILNLLAGPHELFVPVLWPYEVGNILGRAARKGRISSYKARQFMEDLDSFNISIDDGSSYALNRVYNLADQHQLTTYDAAYLELAVRKELPLASLDDDLNKAALSEGIILLQP